MGNSRQAIVRLVKHDIWKNGIELGGFYIAYFKNAELPKALQLPSRVDQILVAHECPLPFEEVRVRIEHLRAKEDISTFGNPWDHEVKIIRGLARTFHQDLMLSYISRLGIVEGLSTQQVGELFDAVRSEVRQPLCVRDVCLLTRHNKDVIYGLRAVKSTIAMVSPTETTIELKYTGVSLPDDSFGSFQHGISVGVQGGKSIGPDFIGLEYVCDGLKVLRRVVGFGKGFFVVEGGYGINVKPLHLLVGQKTRAFFNSQSNVAETPKDPTGRGLALRSSVDIDLTLNQCLALVEGE